MKYLAFFLFVVLFNTNTAAAQETNIINNLDFQLKIIKANNIKIREVYTYHIKRKGAKVDSALLWAVNFVYDTNKNIVGEIITDDKKKITSTYQVFYNKTDQVTQRIIKRRINDKYIDSTNCSYSYDTTGSQKTIVKFNYLSGKITEIGQYNNNRKLVRIDRKIENSPNGNNTTGFVLADSLFYDPDGELNTIQRYKAWGVKDVAFLYSYEINGDNKTEIVFKQTEDKQYFYSKTIYNKYGQIIQSTDLPYYNPYPSNYGNMNKFDKYIYNANGTINTSIRYDNGKVTDIIKCIYK